MFVVVGLITLMLSIVTTAVSRTNARARDIKRVADVLEVNKALNLYYTTIQRFPVIAQSITIDGNDPLSRQLVGRRFLQSAPLDPLYPDYGYHYVSNVSGTDYIITFCLETNSIRDRYRGCNNTVKP